MKREKKKRTKLLRISGLVSTAEWGDDDIAEIAVTTDHGSTYLLLQTDALGDPYDWVDRYVEVSGNLHREDGHKLLAVTRIKEVADRSWSEEEDFDTREEHGEEWREDPDLY